ncbi:MAG: O-antigen ligase family protein [Clostridiales bacterium]|nr:O-antigen ligase family protein [Clostridiales bacterium]
MRIRPHKICTFVWLTIASIMPVFSAMMSAQLPSIVQVILPFLMLCIALLSNCTGKKLYISFRIPLYYYAWIVFLAFAVISFQNNKVGTVRVICCVLLGLFVAGNTTWIKSSMCILGGITGINVFFTYFFFAFPQFYSVMINIYGYVPSGTSNGTAGYRAGIANHYSQNGIFISVFLILTVVLLLARSMPESKKQKQNNALVIIIIAAFVALLLTGKRGVLIWSVTALVITYLVSSKRRPGRIMRLALLALVAIAVLQILSEIIPAVAYVFERFQSAGEDTASLERLAMWELAIEKFKKNPIFGNGFWSFRTFYAKNLASIWHPYSERYQYLDAHNVYIQVLCETGIVGELIYILAVGLLLRKTIQIVRQMNRLNTVELRFGAMFSLSIQVFYLLYSLTGNCLYDIVFYFYALAAATTLAIGRKITQEQKSALLREKVHHERYRNCNISQSV